MFVLVNSRRLELQQGDIAAQEVDAIVNAANHRLVGGGGVDGAIHRAGGPAILAETRRRYPDGCPTGSAVISGAGNLRSKYVIHAVGPVWSGGHQGEERLLASAYRAALQLVAEYECQSAALPALSTGAYGYPLDQAAGVAIHAAADFLRQRVDNSPMALLRFVLFTTEALATFERTLWTVQHDG